MIPTLYKTFQRWSNGGAVWIISDTHFDDYDMLASKDFNWLSPYSIVTKINKYVQKQDTLIHLGDVGNPEYMQYVNGNFKILIMGNHDKGKTEMRKYFNEVYSGALFIADKILLSHEPISLPFCVNIHGHDHNQKESYKDDCQHINLACNVCNFTPLNLGKFIKNGGLACVKNIHRQTIDRAKNMKGGKYE